MIYMCPESPRWYMKKGRMQDAWASMRKLRSTEIQAARELYYAYVQFEEDSKVSRPKGNNAGPRAHLVRMCKVKHTFPG